MEALFAQYALLGLAVVGGLWIAHLAIEDYREKRAQVLWAERDKRIEQIVRRVLEQDQVRRIQNDLGYGRPPQTTTEGYQASYEELLGYRSPSSLGPQELAKLGCAKPGPLPTKE